MTGRDETGARAALADTDNDTTGRGLACLATTVGVLALVLVAGITALALASPWLLVPVSGVLAYWAQRLWIASARLDQIITEETDRG